MGGPGRKYEIGRVDGQVVLIIINPFGHTFTSYFKNEKEAEDYRDFLIQLEKENENGRRKFHKEK